MNRKRFSARLIASALTLSALTTALAASAAPIELTHTTLPCDSQLKQDLGIVLPVAAGAILPQCLALLPATALPAVWSDAGASQASAVLSGARLPDAVVWLDAGAARPGVRSVSSLLTFSTALQGGWLDAGAGWASAGDGLR